MTDAELDALLKAAVDRFLAWKLPTDFHPDCGISFDGRGKDARGYEKTWPTGTNLLTADQTRAMFEHCVAAAVAALREDLVIQSNLTKSAERERDALRKMVNAADEMRLCLHKPIKNYADDLLDAVVAYDHARLESDAALLAGKEKL